MDDVRTLAIIPARAGSKRLPGKNTLLFAGKPLIQWTIEAALESKFISEVSVSSDCRQTLKLSEKLGVDASIMRPHNLATDSASSVDVAFHALNVLDVPLGKFNYVIFLQPTSPLRDSNQIDEALGKIIENRLDSIVSVCEVEHSPLWCANLRNHDGSLDFCGTPKELDTRSQDLPKYYRLNGAIYVIKSHLLRSEGKLFMADNCFPFIMSQESSVDIDTELDLVIAESILKSHSSYLRSF